MNTNTGNAADPRIEREIEELLLLQSGELRGWRRWRAQRRLKGSAELQSYARELAWMGREIPSRTLDGIPALSREILAPVLEAARHTRPTASVWSPGLIRIAAAACALMVMLGVWIRPASKTRAEVSGSSSTVWSWDEPIDQQMAEMSAALRAAEEYREQETLDAMADWLIGLEEEGG